MMKYAMAAMLMTVSMPVMAQDAPTVATTVAPRPLGPVLLLGLRVNTNRNDVIAQYPKADNMFGRLSAVELAPGMIGDIDFEWSRDRTQDGGNKWLRTMTWKGLNNREAAYQALITKYGQPTERTETTEQPSLRQAMRGTSATHNIRANWIKDGVMITYTTVETASVYMIRYEAVDTSGLAAAF